MAQETSENFYDVLIKELRSEIRAEIYAELNPAKNSEKIKAENPQAYVRDTEASLLTELGPKFFKAQKKTGYQSSPKLKTSQKFSQKDPAIKAQNRSSRELSTEESVQLQILLKLGAQLACPFSESELKKEFRRLAQKYHPDHQLGASVQQLSDLQFKFTSLKNCYDSLKKAF